MPAPRPLKNAPITEAIIDFRVKARSGFRPEEFTELKNHLAADFPRMEERRGLQATFGVIQGKSQQPVVEDLGLQGYFFKTADERTIAQFRVDGFTFNRLHPYTSWETLFPQALELWRLYCSVSKPEVITRLAVRYINRVPLPPGQIRLESYLTAAPVIPAELPQYISNFLSRVTIYDPSTTLAAHIGQALEAETDAQGQHLSAILDIDAYDEAEIARDDPTIEQVFNRLRAFKNLIFFNMLTEKTLRQFE